MRLVCPNCSAQYEVDGSMIPDEGRDVQCSNCGHTWFELPGPRDAEGGSVPASEFFGTSDSDDAPIDEELAEAPRGTDGYNDDGFEEIEEPAPSSRRETRPENLSREVFEDDDDVDETDQQDGDDDVSASTESTEDTVEHTSDDDDADTDDDGQSDTSEAIRAITSAAASFDDDDKEADDDKEEVADTEDEDSDDIPPVAAGPRKRRPADTAALDILREEAERELSQRRARPSENLETQPDLGIGDIRARKTPSRALRARMAHLGEEMPDTEDEAADLDENVADAVESEEPSPNKTRLVSPSDDADDGYEEPRRDLLPDIEEINSTLRHAARGPEAVEAKRRSGFRVGFLLMLFLTVAAVFTYSQAPAIARALPESEPALTSFLDWTNGLRDQISNLIGE